MKADRPRILVSKCIEFDHCRYNGHIMSSPMVHKLKDHVEFIPVCPEMEIGLGVPREAVRLVRDKDRIRLVKSMSGDDHTDDMINFCDRFIAGLPELHGCILKSRSPSCGIKDVKIYPGPGKVSSLSGAEYGMFGRKIIENFPGIPIEDEGRLTNFRLREHFLTRIYTLFNFSRLDSRMRELVKFHTRNKYLFMAYNQSKLKTAGQIVANHEKLDTEEVFRLYEKSLYDIINRLPRYTNNINVLMHIYGYFSKDLSQEEKDYFFSNLEMYRNHQLPLVALTNIIRIWIERFDTSYLREQTFFNPFPLELISSYDSAKGKMYY